MQKNLSEDKVSTVTFSPDGRFLVIAADGKIKLQDIHSGHELLTFPVQGWPIVFSLDGQFLISGGAFENDGYFKIWDISTGKRLASYGNHKKRVKVLAVSPDGRFLASGSNDMTIEVWGMPSSLHVW